MSSDKPCQQWPPTGHPSTLPGDPSLILTTNVDLGDKKMEIMKACSKAISAATGKPESYIAVCINDNASMIFGGSDAPLALGCMYSIGAIAMESNGQVQASVTEQLAPFGVTGDRIYINFFVSSECLQVQPKLVTPTISYTISHISFCILQPLFHFRMFLVPTLAGTARPSPADYVIGTLYGLEQQSTSN